VAAQRFLVLAALGIGFFVGLLGGTALGRSGVVIARASLREASVFCFTRCRIWASPFSARSFCSVRRASVACWLRCSVRAARVSAGYVAPGRDALRK
jgi:hypothetical protein